MAKSAMSEYLKYGTLAIGGLVALYGLAWVTGQSLGKKIGDGLYGGLSNIKMPFAGGVNLTTPNIYFPDIKLPDVNIGTASGGGAITSVWNLVTRKDQVDGYTGTTVPASSTILASANTNSARKAQLDAGTFWQGGVFVDPDDRDIPPAVTTSRAVDANGGGIWVPDPKVQGGGYYIADNSVYGKAGLPLVSTEKPPNASSIFTPTIRSEADKRVIEAQAKANSLVNQQGWYIKDGVWRQRGVDGY